MLRTLLGLEPNGKKVHQSPHVPKSLGQLGLRY
jgi:hypothetical protein